MRAAVFGVLALIASVNARADEPFVSAAEGSRLAIDAIWVPPLNSRASAQVGALNLEGQFQILPNFLLDLDVPWAAGWIPGEAVASRGLGNITAGLHGLWRLTPGLILSLGVTASVPTTYRIGATNEALGSASVLTVAALSRAGYNEYLYLPEFFSVRVPFTVELMLSPSWRYRLEVLLAETFPVGSDVPPVGVASYAIAGGFWLSSSTTFEGHLPEDFVLGFKTQLVALEPLTLVSLIEELDIGYEPPSGFFLRLSGFIGGGANLIRSTALDAEAGAKIGYRF